MFCLSRPFCQMSSPRARLLTPERIFPRSEFFWLVSSLFPVSTDLADHSFHLPSFFFFFIDFFSAAPSFSFLPGGAIGLSRTNSSSSGKYFLCSPLSRVYFLFQPFAGFLPLSHRHCKSSLSPCAAAVSRDFLLLLSAQQPTLAAIPRIFLPLLVTEDKVQFFLSLNEARPLHD